MSSSETFNSRRARIYTGRQYGNPDSTKALVVALDDALISQVSVPGISGSTNLLRYPDELVRGAKGTASAVLDFSPKFERFKSDWPIDLGRITNAAASVEGPHHLDKVLVLEPDEAIEAAKRVNADGISFQLHHTFDKENNQIRNATRIGNAAAANGYEYVIHAYPRRMVRRWFSPWQETEYHYRELPGERTDLRKYTNLILDATAVAIDCGATTVKLPRPGRTAVENTDMAGEIVDFAHRNKVKVIFAGGTLKSAPHFLSLVESDMQAGADGEATGRRYFRSKLGPAEDPIQHGRQILVATAQIVYLGDSFEAAMEYAGVDPTS